VTVTSATYANPLTRGLEFCLGMASWALWDRHLRGMKIGFIAWTVAELAVLTGAALWLTMLFVPAAGMFPLRLMAPLWVGPQGCSTLSTEAPLEECVDTAESGGIAILIER
ncbi:MAG: hypothetical protein WB048_25305, partial [Pseudolabrys sp.]